MSELKICRICGCSKEDKDVVSDLNQKEQEQNTSLKDLISFYCRINLDLSNNNLPTSVCKLCHLQLRHFIAFCENLKKIEFKFTISSDKAADEPVKIKEEEVSPVVEPKMELSPSTPKVHRNGKSAMQNVMNLFSDQLKIPIANQSPNATHVTVDLTNVSESGEISNSWLAKFKVATWMDIVFKCNHCKKGEEIKSLVGFLNHLKDSGISKQRFVCSEPDCDRSYSALNSYINHVTKTHYEHLSFCCVQCGKILYNIGTLINHYKSEHPDIASIYPCIECGYYAQSFTQLKLHVLGHKTQEISDSSSDDDEPAVKVLRSGDPVAGPSSTSTPRGNFHPKAFSNNNNPSEDSNGKARKTYPCDKCERILLTYQGFIYHQLCHSNSKPYSCRHCTSTFRSKQACTEHEKGHK